MTNERVLLIAKIVMAFGLWALIGYMAVAGKLIDNALLAAGSAAIGFLFGGAVSAGIQALSK